MIFEKIGIKTWISQLYRNNITKMDQLELELRIIRRKEKEYFRKFHRILKRHTKIHEIEIELIKLEYMDSEEVSKLGFIPEPKPFEIEKKIIPPRETE